MPSVTSIRLQPLVCGWKECLSTENLKSCLGCHSVSFCHKHYQPSFTTGHSEPCKEIVALRAALEREERKLGEAIFEDEAGYFWKIVNTRKYMRARYELADAVMKLFGKAGGRVEAVRLVLDHFLDMIRLCRGDNLGVRDMIPALYIRLGRDQEAYDFMKWYATTGIQRGYNWFDMDLPFLNLRGENIHESTEGLWSGDEAVSLSHYAAITLVKIRALLRLQASVSTVREPQATAIQSKGQHTTNNLSMSTVVDCDAQDVPSKISELEEQVRGLYDSINSCNAYFWAIILEGQPNNPRYRPRFYSSGSREEAYMVTGLNISAWLETPGAMEMMRARHQEIRGE